MAKKDNTKPIKKPHEYSPVIGSNGLYPEEGDNARFLQAGLGLMALPPVDVSNGDEVEQRTVEYFHYCIQTDTKPSVSGYSMALGVDRRRLWEIKTDHPNALRGASVSTTDAIKKGYQMLEYMWEQYATEGKIHPTYAIFMGVNNFGYQNTNDVKVVLPADDPLGAAPDADNVTAYKKQLEASLVDDN